MFDRWIVLNIAIQLSFDAAVYLVLGPRAILYLLGSFFFSVGLHPLGARWIQEHYLVAAPQGNLQLLWPAEHSRSQCRISQRAPRSSVGALEPTSEDQECRAGMYNSLVYHVSWTRLLIRFIFDPRIDLFSRTVRLERGNVALDAEVKPDIEFILVNR